MNREQISKLPDEQLAAMVHNTSVSNYQSPTFLLMIQEVLNRTKIATLDTDGNGAVSIQPTGNDAPPVFLRALEEVVLRTKTRLKEQAHANENGDVVDSERTNKAWLAGFDAGVCGTKIDTNPYQRGAFKRAWRFGHAAGTRSNAEDVKELQRRLRQPEYAA